MMFENGAYAKIWKLCKPNAKGTSMKAQIRIVQRRGEEYITQYQGTVFFCNDTVWDNGTREVIPTIENLLNLVPDARTRDVSFDDEDMPKNMAPSVKIKHCGCGRTWDKERQVEKRCDFIWDFEIPNNNRNTSKPNAASKPAPKQNGSFVNIPDSAPITEELPFA